MSKQKIQIVGSVRIGDTVYMPGMEEALSKVLTKDQAKHLVEQGAIVGVEVPSDDNPDEGDPPKHLTGSEPGKNKSKDSNPPASTEK